MKLNHKFRLVDDELHNLSAMKSRMSSVLYDNKMSEAEKSAIYGDMLARMKNYREEIDKPITVKLAEEIKHTPVLIKEGGTNKKIEKMSSNAEGELVIDGRVIPGSSLTEILSHVYKGGTSTPVGLEEFITHLDSIGATNRIAVKPKPVPRVKNTNTIITRALGKLPSTPALSSTPSSTPTPASSVISPSITPGQKNTPTKFRTFYNKKNTPGSSDVFHTPTTSRKSLQTGTGKRLYIKLWKL